MYTFHIKINSSILSVKEQHHEAGTPAKWYVTITNKLILVPKADGVILTSLSNTTALKLK